MKKFICILLTVMCLCLALPVLADGLDVGSMNLSVNGAAIDASACSNADGALCLPMLPVAEALGYSVDKSELSADDAYRVVYTLTYSIVDSEPSAVAVSKDQVLLPLKQSMTLVDDEPYMPTDFFETGMCVTFTLDGNTNTLDILSVICD